MDSKHYIIAVIKNEDKILMRKKPDGSPPYNETWYLFGVEASEAKEMVSWAKDNLGIAISVAERVGEAREIKKDHDGIEKEFVYDNYVFNYVGGEVKIPEGAEKVEWVSFVNLNNYNIVPPSRKLFQDLKYI